MFFLPCYVRITYYVMQNFIIELEDSLVHIVRLFPHLSMEQIQSWFHGTDKIHLNTLKCTWLQNLNCLHKKISLINLRFRGGLWLSNRNSFQVSLGLHHSETATPFWSVQLGFLAERSEIIRILFQTIFYLLPW